MAKRKKNATVTIKLNRDGTRNIKSTGGFDLRKLFPPQPIDDSSTASSEEKREER